jgi:photosynthetic reaction center cytochrome c subunit
MIKRISARILLKATVGLLLLFSVGLCLERTTTANSKGTSSLDQASYNPRMGGKTHLFTRHAFQQPAQNEKTIGEARKNIKVLNAFPESQLIPMMNLMAASLGVQCNYCHVFKDRQLVPELDEKPEKNTAREMITMTLNLNKTVKPLNGEVSCFTCHKGRTSPLSVVVLPLPTSAPRPSPGNAGGGAQPAAPQITADQVLNKYIAAIGGQAAIDNLKTRIMKGTFTTADGRSQNIEIDQAAPDRVRVVFTSQQGTMERGFNGSAGWEKNPRGVSDLPSQQLEQLQSAFALFRDLKLKDQFTRMNARKDKLNGKDVNVILAANRNGKRERLYFDAETGLLLRRVTTTQTPLGIVPEQLDYEDYRDVDGLKIPFTIKGAGVDAFSNATRTFAEIKINAPIDDASFNKPVAASSTTEPKP